MRINLIYGDSLSSWSDVVIDNYQSIGMDVHKFEVIHNVYTNKFGVEKFKNRVELIINRIKEKVYSVDYNIVLQITPIVLTSLILVDPVFAQATGVDFTPIDKGGRDIIKIIQKLGFWIILIKGMIEVIKRGIEGDKRGIGEVVMLYILFYGSLLFMPWMFKIMEGIFNAI